MTGFAGVLGATALLCAAGYVVGLVRDWWWGR